MEKIKTFLANTNYAVLGFSAFAARLALCGASIGDAIALFAFAGLYGFKTWMNHQEIIKHNEQFESAVKVEFQKVADELSKVKTAMGALNLGSTYRASMRQTPNVGQQR